MLSTYKLLIAIKSIICLVICFNKSLTFGLVKGILMSGTVIFGSLFL